MSETTLQQYAKMTRSKLEELKNVAEKIVQADKTTIIGLNGSFARLEATQKSDLDLFIIYEKGFSEAEQLQRRFVYAAEEQGFIAPSSGGVFEKPLSAQTMLKNIGGARR